MALSPRKLLVSNSKSNVSMSMYLSGFAGMLMVITKKPENVIRIIARAKPVQNYTIY